MATLAFSIDKLMKQKQQQQQNEVTNKPHDMRTSGHPHSDKISPVLLSPPPSPQQLQQFLLNNYWRQMMMSPTALRPPQPPCMPTGPLWTQMWLQQQNQMRNMQQFAPAMTQDMTMFNAYNQYIQMLQQQDQQRPNMHTQQHQRPDAKKLSQHLKVSKSNMVKHQSTKMDTKLSPGMFQNPSLPIVMYCSNSTKARVKSR